MLVQEGCAVRDTLEILDISSCSGLWHEDIQALSGMSRLRELSMRSFGNSGLLALLVRETAPLWNTLEALDVSFSSALNSTDVVAISCMARLGEPNLCNCSSLRGSLRSLAGDDSCALRSSLRVLRIPFVDLSPEDIGALTKLSLEDLTVTRCDLESGSLVSFGNDCPLRGSLHKLGVSLNRLAREEVAALSKLGLRCVDMSCCDLQEGSLVPLGESVVLRETLQMLNVSDNDSLGRRDREAVEAIRGLACIGMEHI